MEIKITLTLQAEYSRRYGRYETTPKLEYVVEDISPDSFAAKHSITAKEYIPQRGDKLFFLPGCTVPRFKMKKFCEEYKTAMVKYKESATALFVGPDTISALVKSCETYRIKADYFKAQVQRYCGPAFIEMVDQVTAEYVYVSGSSIKDQMLNLTQGHTLNLSPTHCGARSTIFRSEADLKTFQHIQEASNIFHQRDVTRRLNSGAEMDENQFQLIKRLFRSTDYKDVKVAMEIMANCDYEKSAVYLLLLIHEFGTKPMVSCPLVDHVNFKALLKFFGLSSVVNVSLDKVIETLINNKLLSRNNLDVIMPIAQEILKQKTGLSYFECGEFKFSEEIERGLQENILDATHNTIIYDDSEEQLNPHL